MPGIDGEHNRDSANSLKREKLRKHWFSGSMAQAMVLLNGLILTITAYATLHVFIGQVITESAASVHKEAREHIAGRFEYLEKNIVLAAAAASFSGKVSAEDIVEGFLSSISKSGYDRIYWLEQNADGKYTPHNMGGGDNENRSDGEIHKYVIQNIDKNTVSPQLMTLLEGGVATAGESDFPMIVAKAVQNISGSKDIVYGLGHASYVIAPAFLHDRQNIRGVYISYGKDNKGLFKYARKGAEGSTDGKIYQKVEYLTFGGKTVKIVLDVDLSQREVFLKNIPFLMLLFGMILTLIGTLYVRTNQRQSIRLAAINIELNRKNSELNREIIEREKLNLALRKAEKENHAVIDAVSDIIFETSTDGQILFLNETWHKITGFSPERSINRNLFDLLYQQDQAEQKNNFAQLVKGKKQSYRAFTRLRTADGSFRAVELAVSMLRQDENKQMRVVGTITDVEERRRAERALSEAEKKYRAIVENSASGIYQVTPEGHYLSVNPAFARILGYVLPEDLLRDVRNANTDVYYNGRERERHLRDAVRSGTGVHFECQVRRRDGSVIWVEENLRVVRDENDQIIFFEGSMDDISKRKETEIALREAKIASDLANRAKSEFLTNMSHELRTPLNAIIGFSDIIRNQAFGEVGRPEYLDYARDINDSGKRLLQVINDILDVSRIEAGDRQLNEGVVDLNKSVIGTLEMLAPKIDASRMIVSNLVNEATPKLVGESHAIKQMLMNLLSNAVKFTPDGGRISIHAEVDDSGQMHVSVTDTGIGLTDEEIEKALSPFGQVNTALNKNESGTGLGLTLVQSLMSLHGGSFELFSQKGVGTTATLIFPAKRVSHQSMKTPEKV